MDKNICKLIVENKDNFAPIFTTIQISILDKYIRNKKLTNTEKTYLYSSIKKKIEPLTILKEEYHITGNNMLPERLKKAKSIIKNIKEKAFISGSFLYNKNYNDIDIYIISNKRKQYTKNKHHYIFLTEKDLRKPLFNSASKYSIANFFIKSPKPIIKRPLLDEVILMYELSINEALDNDDQKMMRTLIFEYYAQIKKQIINSFILNKKFNKIKNLKKIERINYINKITEELFLNLYSKKYTYNILSPFITKLKKDKSKNKNIQFYINLFTKIKNECRYNKK